MKYTTTFSSSIKPLVAEEKDKYLAMASLLEVSQFVPDIDSEKNIDLLPIAFNACVVNRVNKNGDVIDTSTALWTFTKTSLTNQLTLSTTGKRLSAPY